jgi:hypothetical protein
LLRVDYGGTVLHGRLSRSDCDPEHRHNPASPYGILVLENLGLMRSPEMILQIADIHEDAIRSLPN